MFDDSLREAVQLEASGSCCVEMTTASMRTGLSPSYSTLTWTLPSGRRKLGTARAPRVGQALLSLCASRIGSGISSGRFVAGITEHQALVAGAAGVHAHGDVRRLRSTEDITAHVLESKPKAASV